MSADLKPVTGDRINRKTKEQGWRNAYIPHLPVSAQQIEVAYRNLRADWMNVKSRARQKEAELLEAKRSGSPMWAEAVGRELQDLIRVSGQLKRMASLVGSRAHAEVYREIAEMVLPTEARIAINDLTERMLEGPEIEMVSRNGKGARGSSGARAAAEEAAYLKQLQDIIQAWAPGWAEPDEEQAQ